MKKGGHMRVKDIMTMDPDCCTPATVATKAARIMKEENVGLVPVVDSESDRKVVGVVTDRDLCLAVVAAGQHPDSVLVRDAMMAKNIVTCRPEDDLEKVINCMRENQVRRVPIVDTEGKLRGIVSIADILQHSDLPSGATHETLKTISEPSEHASLPRAQTQRAA